MNVNSETLDFETIEENVYFIIPKLYPFSLHPCFLMEFDSIDICKKTLSGLGLKSEACISQTITKEISVNPYIQLSNKDYDITIN